MYRTLKYSMAVAIAVWVVGFCTSVAAAAFINPPELNHPDRGTPFPYQRNILVGFESDPHAWPDPITSPTPDERKAPTPSVVHHEGTDDAVLYSSDWFGGDVQPPNAGSTSWLNTDTWTGTQTQGHDLA